MMNGKELRIANCGCRISSRESLAQQTNLRLFVETSRGRNPQSDIRHPKSLSQNQRQRRRECNLRLVECGAVEAQSLRLFSCAVGLRKRQLHSKMDHNGFPR